MLSTIRPSFFLLLLRQDKKLGVSIYEEKLSRQKQGECKLAIGKMKSGLPSESSSIMVLPPGQKIDPGAIAPLFICLTALSSYRLLLKLLLTKPQEPSICW
jgi:hypothetical protein